MMLPKELTTVTPLSKILAIVLFITLPLVGFLFGMRYQETMDLAERQEMGTNLSIPRTPTPEAIPIAIPTTDPQLTANWKTYINTEVGYSVRHPDDFKIDESAGLTVIYKGKVEVPPNSVLDPYKIALAIYNRSSDCVECYGFNLKKIGVAGYTAIKRIEENSLFEEVWIYSSSDDRAVRINYGVDEKTEIDKNKTTFDQILATFKFTDQTSSEGKFCGGIAGVPCSEGYKCQLDGTYPDAGGKCVKQ